MVELPTDYAERDRYIQNWNREADLSDKKIPKIMTIKSSMWLRNKDRDKVFYSALKVKEKYCCIGIHALFCNVDKDELEDISSPYELNSECPIEDFENCWLDENLHDNEVCEVLMAINDSYHINEDKRILEISRIFLEKQNIIIDWRMDQ